MVYEQEPHKCVVDVMKCREMHRLSSPSLLLPPFFSLPSSPPVSSCSLILCLQTLDLTAVRLISRPTLSMPTGLELWLVLQLMTLLSKRRAANTLIRIRRLLDHHFLVRALARAAAHAERPEETRGDAEGHTNPHDLQHLVAH